MEKIFLERFYQSYLEMDVISKTGLYFDFVFCFSFIFFLVRINFMDDVSIF